MSDSTDFLQRLYPGGPWCLSAATPERDKLDTRTFDDAAAADAWIAAWNGQRNLYFHVNPPRDKNARSKLKRTDVREVCYLHVDIDPPRRTDPEGKLLPNAAPEAEVVSEFRERTLGLLLKHDPAPTVIINSGNGLGVFWKLESPIPLDGTLPTADDAGLYNRTFAQNLAGGDACHNVDRLMRLPGTWNIPGESKHKKGYFDRRLAELLSFEASNVYPISKFKKAVADGDNKQASLLDSYEIGAPVQLKELAELNKWNVPLRVQLVCAKGSDPNAPKKGDNSRSAWVYDVICQLIRFNVPEEVILGILLDPEWGISESVREKTSPGPEAYARRQIEKARRHAKQGEHSPQAAATGGGGGGGPPPHQPAITDADNFAVDQAGTPYPTKRNLLIALHKMGVSVSRDLFCNRSLIDGLSGFGPHLDDAAMRRLRISCQTQFQLKIGREDFVDYVEDTCMDNRFHPVLNYLDGLTWDGTPRLDTWLIRHAGVADSPYSRAVSRLLLIAAVRRVRQPGAAFDEMLVLISPEQGWGKSKSIRQLCPDPSWFSDDLPLSSDSRVVIERSAGKWIIEAAELKGLRRSEAESLKAFMSRTSDTARLAYGRLPAEILRQFVMFGTTNSLRFLQDPTGNRRFWPLLLQKMMVPELVAKERDQLWAEASNLESQGESIRMDPSLYASAGNMQKAHSIDDPLKDALEAVLGDHTGIIASNDIWELLQISVERRNGLASARTQALSELGWHKGNGVRTMSSGSKEAFYQRGNSQMELSISIDSSTKRARIVESYSDERAKEPF